MPTSSLPSIAEITAFFQKYLPPSINAREVPFLYHTPRSCAYNPASQQLSSIVLSITPTPGFYSAINASRNAVGFLHRPWALDRRALRRDATVFACHASFDEHLTVGWNVASATRLGLETNDAICIQGYKNNPDRKIGLVARFVDGKARDVHDLAAVLKIEHDGAGELHLPEDLPMPEKAEGPLTEEGSDNEDGGVKLPPSEVPDQSRNISVVAIMNAFHHEEIQRVLTACREKQWIAEDEAGSSILYLTGAARDYGLEAIRNVNMAAFCVGHRACEEWGIRFLASELMQKWPNLDVVKVLEEEEPPLKKAKKVDDGEVQPEVRA